MSANSPYGGIKVIAGIVIYLLVPFTISMVIDQSTQAHGAILKTHDLGLYFYVLWPLFVGLSAFPGLVEGLFGLFSGQLSANCAVTLIALTSMAFWVVAGKLLFVFIDQTEANELGCASS